MVRLSAIRSDSFGVEKQGLINQRSHADIYLEKPVSVRGTGEFVGKVLDRNDFCNPYIWNFERAQASSKGSQLPQLARCAYNLSRHLHLRLVPQGQINAQGVALILAYHQRFGMVAAGGIQSRFVSAS